MGRVFGLVTLVACISCTSRDVRRGALSESTDSLQLTTPSLSGVAVQDTFQALHSEEPRVVFYCEGGRIGAYIVMGESGDSARIGDRAVPVKLDSAPAC